MNLISFIPLSGIIALIFVYVKNRWVTSNDVGSKKMERIAKNISDGAMAFLKAEYKILAVFVFFTSILLALKGEINQQIGKYLGYLDQYLVVMDTSKVMMNQLGVQIRYRVDHLDVNEVADFLVGPYK